MGKKAIPDIDVPLAKDVLPKIVRNMVSNVTLKAINKLGRKSLEQGDVRAERGFTLFISNEHMDDIIKKETHYKNQVD